MNYKEIGKQIQSSRKSKELTQEELADKVNISSAFVSIIERGVKSPSLENFVNICNVLGVSADVVLESVLENGYKTKASILSELLEGLEPEEQQRILNVVEVLIKKP